MFRVLWVNGTTAEDIDLDDLIEALDEDSQGLFFTWIMNAVMGEEYTIDGVGTITWLGPRSRD
jgi:hypothetical protein